MLIKAETLRDEAHQVYKDHFGETPEVVATAPGRVNLMGEHTDYNGGFVLPLPLDLGVAVAIGQGPDVGRLDAYSRNLGAAIRVSLTDPARDQWTDFVLGCFHTIDPKPDLTRGYRVAVVSTLPMGAGVSSSAALEVATLRALTGLSRQESDPVAIAQMAQKVEREFVGMPCGIMDQFAASVGRQGKALFLDTRSLAFQVLPLFPEYQFVVVHSGVSHKLTDGGYAQRVAECEHACKALGVKELRDMDISDLDRISAIPSPENIRARHVVTENQRVLDAVTALKEHDVEAFGALMWASHMSQRDDYSVSVPETDALAAGAMSLGAAGARLTGGGFGGSIVALVQRTKMETWSVSMREQFPTARKLAVTSCDPDVSSQTL